MKKRKILMVIFVFALLLTLVGCKNKTYGVDNMMLPISNPGYNDGWFTWLLVRPIAWFLNLFSFGGYYAFGIIFTTIMVRTLAWPVYAKSNDMSLKMNLAQPEMNRIQAKYANRQDQLSQQKMQMEMMAVMKKYKINIWGCLAIPFIQFPLFMAMYDAVQRFPITQALDAEGNVIDKPLCTWFTRFISEDAKYIEGSMNSNFLGIDLSKGLTNISMLGTWSNWIYVILPIFVGITMAGCQIVSQIKPSYAKKAYPNQNNNPQAKSTEKTMKIMMWVMTAMMVLMSFRSGTLCLYWIVGNTYSIFQTLINRKINEKRYYKLAQQSSVTGIVTKPPKKEKIKKVKVKNVYEEPKQEKTKKGKLNAPKNVSDSEDAIKFDVETNNNEDIQDVEFEETNKDE